MRLADAFLPGLPVELIRKAYEDAPGNEFASGKFVNPESSAALVANTFGYFLERPSSLPPLPGCGAFGLPTDIGLEKIVRFPWSGGHHPCLDVLIETSGALIGIESKRFEPYRGPKPEPSLSEAYWRPVWGQNMRGYERIRDDLRQRAIRFQHLDAAQLVKHAFGLRTDVQKNRRFAGKKPVLVYLYAEPSQWASGKTIDANEHGLHLAEAKRFAEFVADDEVAFVVCSYRTLLASWGASDQSALRDHTQAVRARYDV